MNLSTASEQAELTLVRYFVQMRMVLPFIGLYHVRLGATVGFETEGKDPTTRSDGYHFGIMI